MKFAIVVSLGLLALASPAAAQSPVAVVEEIQGKVTGAEFMDYVTPKSVIKIGEDGSIVLSYMKSCRREKISGVGTVIVGTEESTVHLADVKAEKTNCDSNQANATTRQTSGVAATVLRSVDRARRLPAGATAHALWRIAARGSQGTRQADRCSASTFPASARRSIWAAPSSREGSSTSPARTSRWCPAASTRPRSSRRKIVFRVDPQAKPGATPIVGRLLRME